MKICVTGSFGGGDIGDDAMVFPHLSNLACLGVSREDVWLIGFQPDYMARHFSHPHRLCLSCDAHVAKEVLDSTDLLLVTGGGTINTRAQDGWSLRRMYRLVMAFVKHGTPVFMSGQTIGPLGVEPDHDALAKELVESVDILTVRDMLYSRKYLEKIGAQPKQLAETVDDATLISPDDRPLPIELPEGKRAAINVTVYTFDTPEKVEAIKTLCHRLACMGYNVLLVPHHPWDHEAMMSLRVPNTQLIDTTSWLGITTKRLFAECDLVIAGRYHAVVFAMTAGVPCVGMAGNHYSWIKQHGFADQLGVGDRIVPPDKVTDVDNILELAMRSMKSSVSYVIPEPSSFHLFRKWFKEKTCSS